MLNVIAIIGNSKCKIILTYLATSDQQRNLSFKESIRKTFIKDIHLPTLLLGDLNGHLGFIGVQKLNATRKIMLEIMEQYNLMLLNADNRCHRQTTWSRN